jgi:hypothetical protein
MLSVFGIVARLALSLGMAFALSRTMPSMRNGVSRFVLVFLVCVPWNFAINYFDVRLLGYHHMSSTGAFVIALLVAALFAFFPPQHARLVQQKRTKE